MKAILTIGGTDPTSAAGVFRDLNVFYENNIYGIAIVTAVTAQNSNRYFSHDLISQKVIKEQLKATFGEFDIHYVKLGMLASSKTVETIANFLSKYSLTIVYDPVLKSSSGGLMHDKNFEQSIKTHLVPMVDLLTPNIPECEMITGIPVTDFNEETLKSFYKKIGAKNLLIKGGHRIGKKSTDYLVTALGINEYSLERIPNKEVRGTGCSLASAIISELYKGETIEEAIKKSKNWIWEKIRTTKNNIFYY